VNADAKRTTIAVFILAAAALVLLAMALPQLRLQPAVPPPESERPAEAEFQKREPDFTVSFSTLVKTVLEILLTVAGVIVAYKIRKRVSWREVMPALLFSTAAALILLYILYSMQNVHIQPNFQSLEVLPPELELTGPELGPVNPNLIGLVWVLLAAAGIAAGAGLLYWSSRRRPKDALRREAERAIDELRAGSDIHGTIVRCYLQMSRALQKERGIELEQTMTARDFELLLEARGIPRDPVHTLTRLFEQARYGRTRPGPEDEQRAMDCLTAIVRYSRAPRQPE
jgi:hypothetical protein